MFVSVSTRISDSLSPAHLIDQGLNVLLTADAHDLGRPFKCRLCLSYGCGRSIADNDFAVLILNKQNLITGLQPEQTAYFRRNRNLSVG